MCIRWYVIGSEFSVLSNIPVHTYQHRAALPSARLLAEYQWLMLWATHHEVFVVLGTEVNLNCQHFLCSKGRSCVVVTTNAKLFGAEILDMYEIESMASGDPGQMTRIISRRLVDPLHENAAAQALLVCELSPVTSADDIANLIWKHGTTAHHSLV